jgi:hypothetical protein
MTLRHSQRGARGFTLLPVILAMSLIAVVAFLLNRDNGLNARMVSSRADLDRARYAAEAGLQAANFAIQAAGCAGGYPVQAAPITNSNFGGAAYSAYASAASGSPLTLVSTGTYNGASVSLTRGNAYVYQPRKTTVLQPAPAASQDTYVDVGQHKNFGGENRLRLQTGRYQMLVQFDLSSLPAGSRIVPWFDAANARLQPGAVMSLYQYDISSSFTGSLRLDVLLGTRSWLAGTRSGGGTPNGATWTTYDGTNAWPAPGIGYASTPIASTPYTNAFTWVDWDLTNAVSGWLGGARPNHGVWITEAGGTIGNTSYVSGNDTANAALRPKLTLNVLEPCTAVTTRTLSATADAHLRSDLTTRNLGGAALMDVAAGSPEQRILVRFDLSSIPPASVIKNATLRMYAKNVLAPSGSSKSIQAYVLLEPWVEGTMLGSGTANGATWRTRDGSNNWDKAGGTYYDYVIAVGREEATGLSPLPAGFTAGWVSWDMTQLMQAWTDGVVGNFGMLLRSSATDVVEFETRESGSNIAQFIVSYE